MGIRTIYVPYGIEIADTEHAHNAHFNENVVKNSWRVYTFSNTMLEDYKKYSENAGAVRAMGIPKFDNLYNKDKFPINEEIKLKANGRKIVLWKVHFPKVIRERGKNILVTPYIEEYLKFADVVQQYKDLFFVFMPHPRFEEFNDDETVRKQTLRLMRKVGSIDNAYIDNADDYRPSLVNADYIIVDRSAVMVEAGAIGAPILYMYNPNFNEPMTQAITPLIDSYYQGTTCEDMIRFIEMIIRDEDPRKWQREIAFRQCIPYFDGKCGERIKEDIINSLEEERKNKSLSNEEMLLELKERIDNIEKNLSNIINEHIEIETSALQISEEALEETAISECRLINNSTYLRK